MNREVADPVCPSCGISLPALPGDHDLAPLDSGGIKCANGEVVEMSPGAFETVIHINLMTAYRRELNALPFDAAKEQNR